MAGVVRAGGSGAAARRAADELGAWVSVDPVVPSSSATAVTPSPIRSATPTTTQPAPARGSACRGCARPRSPPTRPRRASERRVGPVRGREAVGGSSMPGAENSAAMTSSVVSTARSSSSGCSHSAASRSCSSRGKGSCTAISKRCRRQRPDDTLPAGSNPPPHSSADVRTRHARGVAPGCGLGALPGSQGGEARVRDDSCPVVRPHILEELPCDRGARFTRHAAPVSPR